MKHFTAIALALLALSAAFPTMADDRNEKHGLKQDEARTGSRIINNSVKGGGIPFNKTYDQLTDEQKRMVKAPYASMGPNDEPPFPAAGKMPIMREVDRAQAILLVHGEVRLIATINPDGTVKSVAVMKSVEPRMDTYVAGVLMRTKFKPALCNNVPCTQDYEFAMSFDVEY